MEPKTYEIHYTPTLTNPDPEPDTITGVWLQDRNLPPGFVKFDVGNNVPLLLLGVEKVVELGG